MKIQDNNVKVVILAGGLGTRLEEETVSIPKPLVNVGEYPILWHIMKIYSACGFNDFIICLGYKGYLIKQYFANYFLHHSDVTFDFSSGEEKMVIHSRKAEPWRVTLVDTGLKTQTGGRIKRIESYIDGNTFMLSYGDTVSNINMRKLLEFHHKHGKAATLSAVQPPGKWGSVKLGNKGQVQSFIEKPVGDGAWINGGFFVLNTSIFKYLTKADETVWEWDPLERLAQDGQLMSYEHSGFWKCMDTLRNKNELEQLWLEGNPPWRIWDEKKTKLNKTI